jgi:DNA-binding IclR family transcriptional regulator
MTEQPGDLVQSVSRALRVLEEVARSSGPVPVKVIARRAKLNLSTTYHLMRTLAYEGYLVRHTDGRYSVGPQVGRRYRDVRNAFGHRPEVHQVLAHLAASTDHSAYLGRFVDGQIVITDLVEGAESPYLEDLEVGLSTSAHATAVGKVLLATLPPDRRRVYLQQQGMPKYTSLTPVDTEALEDELARIRPGIAFVESGQFREGWSCAASLVRRGDPGDPWWALVVSARSEDVPITVRTRLLEAADDLSTAV